MSKTVNIARVCQVSNFLPKRKELAGRITGRLFNRRLSGGRYCVTGTF